MSCRISYWTRFCLMLTILWNFLIFKSYNLPTLCFKGWSKYILRVRSILISTVVTFVLQHNRVGHRGGVALLQFSTLNQLLRRDIRLKKIFNSKKIYVFVHLLKVGKFYILKTQHEWNSCSPFKLNQTNCWILDKTQLFQFKANLVASRNRHKIPWIHHTCSFRMVSYTNKSTASYIVKLHGQPPRLADWLTDKIV